MSDGFHGIRIAFAVTAALSLPVFPAALAAAETATGTVNATISNSGSVGDNTPAQPPPTTTPTTTTPVSTGSTANTSTTNGGGANSQSAAVEQSGVTTFRPLPGTGPAAGAEGGEGDAAADTDADTAAGGDQTAGPAAATGAGSRLPTGAQPVGDLMGGLSSVAVTGSPNQTFGISLPGETVIVTGSQTLNIQGFVHNAGDTPAMNAAGRSSFNVGARVKADGAGGGAEAGAAAGTGGGTGDGTGALAPNYQGPVITSDPFMDVIISYN